MLLFGLAIALPLVLLLAALLFHSASIHREQLEDRVVQVLHALVGDLDRELDNDITILQTLATSSALAAGDWPSFYNQAKAALQGRTYLVLVDADGRQLVNTYVPYGEQPPITGDLETLRRVRQTKVPVISNLFVSLVVKKPVLNVSIPVLRDGEVRYSLSLGLLPDDLLALLNSQRLGPEWVTMVWDTNGIVLARSRDHSRYLGSSLPNHLRQQQGQEILRTRNLDGTDVFHAAARSELSGWGVGVNLPAAVVNQPLHQLLLLWGAGAAAVLLVALALSLFFARPITSSLAAASQAATAFGHGEPVVISGSALKEVDAFLDALKAAQQELLKVQNHQDLLVRELQHRTQNLFAVVQSITGRTLVEGQTITDAKRVLIGRLQALARTYTILAATAWEGAPLSEIVKREFGEAFAKDVDVKDCDIVINAAAAQQLALIIHELTTNAFKYGALSVPGGRVSIIGNTEGTTDTGHFSLLWSETGGPVVTPPARKGFGSTILFEAAKQFGMQVALNYERHGLIYELQIPLRLIVPEATTRT